MALFPCFNSLHTRIKKCIFTKRLNDINVISNNSLFLILPYKKILKIKNKGQNQSSCLANM